MKRKNIVIMGVLGWIIATSFTSMFAVAGNEKPERLEMNIREEITILENGSALMTMLLNISSSSLCNLYREAFGIQNDTNTDIEIPECIERKMELRGNNGEVYYNTWIEPIREKFYEGIYMEQKALYGLQIKKFIKSGITIQSLDKMSIYLEAEATPDIHLINETILEIRFPPENVTDTFIRYQMQVAKLMLKSMEGYQKYIKSWKVIFNLPQNANLFQMDALIRTIEIGSGDIFNYTIYRNENSVIIEGEYIVTESICQKIQKERIYYPLTIRYTVPDDFNGEIEGMDYEDIENPRVYYVNWTWNIINIHAEGEIYNGTAWIDWEAGFNLKIKSNSSVVIDWNEVYLETIEPNNLRFEATAYFNLSGGIDKTISIWSGSLNKAIHFWRGTELARVTLGVDLEFTVRIVVDGYMNISIYKWEEYYIKAGAKWSFAWGWPPIQFERIWKFRNVESGFDPTLHYHLHIMVKPRFGVGIGVYLWGLVGPRVEPGLYFRADIGWKGVNTDWYIYWHVAIGLDVYVGVGFLGGALHWNWPNPLIDIILWEQSNIKPEEEGAPPPPPIPDDTTPPVTRLYLLPEINGWTGELTRFWFSVIDEGAEATGNVTTYFKVPESINAQTWQQFNYSLHWYIWVHDEPGVYNDYYNISYYSIDEAGNAEDIHIESVDVDLSPPFSYITTGEPSCNYYLITPSTPIIIQVSEEEGCGEWIVYYNVTNSEGEASGWINTDVNDPAVFTLEDLEFTKEGEYRVWWYAEDLLGNGECLKNRTFYIDLTGPSITKEIGNPKYGSYLTTETAIILTASDLAGVKEIHYVINGEEHVSAGSSVVFYLDEECEHEIEYWAVDNLGNEGEHIVQTHHVDNTPPITTIEFGKPYYTDGVEEWITSWTTVYLNSTDYPDCACGVKEIHYSYDGGITWHVASGNKTTFTIPEECEHTILWYAVDNLGNTEAINNIVVYVDDTPPVTNISWEGYGNYVALDTTFIITTKDYGCSGGVWHNTIYWRINEGPIYSRDANVATFILEEPGIHLIEYWAKDGLGNEEKHHVISIMVDAVPPKTNIIFDPEGLFENGTWYISPHTIISFESTDSESGVKMTKYRIVNENDTGWLDFDESFSLYIGRYTIYYYSVDNVGNTETAKTTNIVVSQDLAPVTVCNINPPTPNGKNGWYISNVTISLSANDRDGIKVTYYRIDNGEWRQYKEPINLISDGIHILDYYSIDIVGFEENIKTVIVKIDKKLPSISIDRPKDAIYIFDREIARFFKPIIIGKITVKAKVYDEMCIEKAYFKINNEIKKTFDMELQYTWEEHAIGCYMLTIVATDEAGNEKKKEIDVIIINL